MAATLIKAHQASNTMAAERFRSPATGGRDARREAIDVARLNHFSYKTGFCRSHGSLSAIQGSLRLAPYTRETYGNFAVPMYVCMYVRIYVALRRPHVYQPCTNTWMVKIVTMLTKVHGGQPDTLHGHDTTGHSGCRQSV